MTDARPSCPYCGAALSKWANPDLTSWSGEYQFVCFNDACSYFVRGWAWMEEHYSAHASYRHRMDPTTGETGPLPVWSKDALKSSILPDEDGPHDR